MLEWLLSVMQVLLCLLCKDILTVRFATSWARHKTEVCLTACGHWRAQGWSPFLHFSDNADHFTFPLSFITVILLCLPSSWIAAHPFSKFVSRRWDHLLSHLDTSPSILDTWTGSLGKVWCRKTREKHCWCGQVSEAGSRESRQEGTFYPW